MHFFIIENVTNDNRVKERISIMQGNYGIKEINRLIVSLPDDLRIPFSMHLAGYKYSEISSYMNISIEEVKHRIFFARERLHDALELL